MRVTVNTVGARTAETWKRPLGRWGGQAGGWVSGRLGGWVGVRAQGGQEAITISKRKVFTFLWPKIFILPNFALAP